MGNMIARALEESGSLLPYDAACKRLLSEREILARIMKECVPEYAGCDVKDIATRYIKDDPLVGSVPLTYTPSRVTGLRNDDAVPGEGRVTYDIRFSAEAPGREGPIGLIVNVEAQGAADRGRRLLSRAVFYCARMLSSQYGEVFAHSRYEDIRKVYSIWICLHPPKGQENTIVRYAMTREDVVGTIDEDPSMADLLCVVVVRLGEPGSSGYTGSILDMLATLLSREVTGPEKLRMLRDDCGIEVDDELEGEVALMGSFAEHIFLEAREAGLRDGREEGLAQGREEGLAQGREEGLAQGRTAGHAEGVAEGRAEGREQGRALGREEGREEGRTEGRSDALTGALRALMDSTGWGLERAMDALAVSGREREDCRTALASSRAQ